MEYTSSLYRKSGIYRIDGPGRFYVGSALSLGRRWIEHQRDLRRCNHANPYLQNAWLKHGEAAFAYSVIEIVDDPSRLLEREQHWIATLDVVTVGYNILPTAGSRYGLKHREETKRLMSKAHTGRKHGPMSEEQKAYYSALYKGRSPSPESIKKSADSRRGMKFSAERCANISAALTGKIVSPETRAKIAAIRTGTKASEETKAKMRAAHKGKVISEAQKQKLREAWARKRAEKQSQENSSGIADNNLR